MARRDAKYNQKMNLAADSLQIAHSKLFDAIIGCGRAKICPIRRHALAGAYLTIGEREGILFYRYAAREVARLVGIGVFDHHGVIGEAVDRDRVWPRRDKGVAALHRNAEGEAWPLAGSRQNL